MKKPDPKRFDRQVKRRKIKPDELEMKGFSGPLSDEEAVETIETQEKIERTVERTE